MIKIYHTHTHTQNLNATFSVTAMITVGVSAHRLPRTYRDVELNWRPVCQLEISRFYLAKCPEVGVVHEFIIRR